MRHFWSIVNPSRPFKRLSPAIANTSQPAKRRKTFHRGDADTEDQRPTTSYTTQMDDRDECQNSCHQVFLSHSGYQKSFVEQLFLDLQKENISCFFDKDAESLPKGEDFPSRILKAARECRVGVVVLSDEFISSKWPMLELCEFVRAKNSTSGKLKILPLFFRLTPQSLCQKLQEKDSLKRSWQQLLKAQNREINLDDWVDALKALRAINGVVYNEQESEVDYRAQIVSSIRTLLPPKLRYDEPYVQGKHRLCQEVAQLFNNTPCGEDGVKMVGLFGVAGIGKTTLARAVCNFYFNDFDGRVLHVELGKQMAIERLKKALLILTNASKMLVDSITDIEEGWFVFRQRMMRRTVFLAVDNISDLEESIDETQRYLTAVRSAGNQSQILLTSRSTTILRRFIPEGERSCMRVPSLTEEEAIPVLLQLTPLRASNLSSEEQDIAKKCALKCYCRWHGTGYNDESFSAYHPLALRSFGTFLYDSCADSSRWIDIQTSSEPWRSGQEKLFSIFEESFKRLIEDHKNIFMLLCLYLPESHMVPEEAFNWLALACDTKLEHIKVAILQLKRMGFVESRMESGNHVYIHDLHIEFAANKADGAGKWISLKERFGIPASLQENDRPRFLAMKFDSCHFQCHGFVNNELFRNLLVLHLQNMPRLKIINLSPMRIVRSITIVGCGGVQDIRGLESLTSLVYFVVKGCAANVQFSGMEGLVALQHLHVDANLPETTTEPSPLSWTSFPPLQSASDGGTIRFDHIVKSTWRLGFSIFTGLTAAWNLRVQGMHNLKEFPTLTRLTALRDLRLMRMHSLKELPTLTGLTALRDLHLEGMHSLKELPTLTGLTALHNLHLEGMHSVKELPTLTGLTALRGLVLEGMHSLKELPTLTGLTALRFLALGEMHCLKELPTLTGLTALRHLRVQGMHNLKELPTFTGLTALDTLWLRGMHSLKELPLTGLIALQILTLEEMHSLKELPTFTGLPALKFIELKGRHSLKELTTVTGFPGYTAFRPIELEEMQRRNLHRHRNESP